MAKLTDLEINREYPMEGKIMTLGRTPDDGLAVNDINLPPIESSRGNREYAKKLIGVSRESHLTFTKKPDGWYVSCKIDRLAYIGGKEISGEAKLGDGTEILVGIRKYRLKFSDSK